MFRLSTDTDYEQHTEGGTRYLFGLDSLQFFDVLDGDGHMRHYVVERDTDQVVGTFETDRDTMYEILARFLAGEYEKREYRLDRSPTHSALLDALEIAIARARAGETEFDLARLDELDRELDDDPDEHFPDPDGWKP